jgi:hypothetical protein
MHIGEKLIATAYGENSTYYVKRSVLWERVTDLVFGDIDYVTDLHEPFYKVTKRIIHTHTHTHTYIIYIYVCVIPQS